MTYRFDITADLRSYHELINVGFLHNPNASGFVIRPAQTITDWRGERQVDTRLIMFWSDSADADYVPFGEALSSERAGEFILNWLELTKPDEEMPDIDGTVCHGFRLYNEGWGRIEDMSYSFLAVSPQWIMYGK